MAILVDGDDIESHRGVSQLRLAAQENFSSPNDSTLLFPANRFRGVCPVRSAAQANLNKYQALAVPHNEVYFAETRTEVSLQERQALSLQIAQGPGFTRAP